MNKYNILKRTVVKDLNFPNIRVDVTQVGTHLNQILSTPYG